MILMSALSVSAKIIICIEKQKNILKYNIIFNIFSRPLLKPLYLYFRDQRIIPVGSPPSHA